MAARKRIIERLMRPEVIVLSDDEQREVKREPVETVPSVREKEKADRMLQGALRAAHAAQLRADQAEALLDSKRDGIKRMEELEQRIEQLMSTIAQYESASQQPLQQVQQTQMEQRADRREPSEERPEYGGSETGSILDDKTRVMFEKKQPAKMDELIHFKLVHGGIARRFELSRGDIGLFSEMKARVLSLTGAEDPNLYWKDDDSKVLLDSEEDLIAAIRFADSQNTRSLACVTLEIGEEKGAIAMRTEQELQQKELAMMKRVEELVKHLAECKGRAQQQQSTQVQQLQPSTQVQLQFPPQMQQQSAQVQQVHQPPQMQLQPPTPMLQQLQQPAQVQQQPLTQVHQQLQPPQMQLQLPTQVLQLQQPAQVQQVPQMPQQQPPQVQQELPQQQLQPESMDAPKQEEMDALEEVKMESNEVEMKEEPLEIPTNLDLDASDFLLDPFHSSQTSSLSEMSTFPLHKMEQSKKIITDCLERVKARTKFPTFGDVRSSLDQLPIILDKLNMTDKDVFAHIGSGAGHVITYAATYAMARKCVGIESSQFLFDISVMMKEEFEGIMSNGGMEYRPFDLFYGHFFSEEHRKIFAEEATVVYIRNQPLLFKLSRIVDEIPNGTRIIFKKPQEKRDRHGWMEKMMSECDELHLDDDVYQLFTVSKPGPSTSGTIDGWLNRTASVKKRRGSLTDALTPSCNKKQKQKEKEREKTPSGGISETAEDVVDENEAPSTSQSDSSKNENKKAPSGASEEEWNTEKAPRWARRAIEQNAGEGKDPLSGKYHVVYEEDRSLYYEDLTNLPKKRRSTAPKKFTY